MLARRKLNSIESKISEAWINNEISHEDILIIADEQTKYQELKKKIRMMNSQRSDVEKISLIEEGKNMNDINEIINEGINKVIKRNEIINNSLK